MTLCFLMTIKYLLLTADKTDTFMKKKQLFIFKVWYSLKLRRVVLIPKKATTLVVAFNNDIYRYIVSLC